MGESQRGVEEGGIGGCGNRVGLANLLLIFKQQAKTIRAAKFIFDSTNFNFVVC